MSTSHRGNTQPQIDQEEHAHISGVAGKKVFIIDSSGNVVNFPAGASYEVVVDESTTADTTYIGKASTNSATSSSVWQISRLDETVSGIAHLEWADGDASFDNIWDNRASLSYS